MPQMFTSKASIKNRIPKMCVLQSTLLSASNSWQSPRQVLKTEEISICGPAVPKHPKSKRHSISVCVCVVGLDFAYEKLLTFFQCFPHTLLFGFASSGVSILSSCVYTMAKQRLHYKNRVKFHRVKPRK